jgi:hypothetical protein
MERRFDPRENPAHSQGEDDLNSQERASAKCMGAVLDADKDFGALRRLVDSVKIADDADVAELRELIAAHDRKRLHLALDRVLDRFMPRRCAGDRDFLRRVGVRP